MITIRRAADRGSADHGWLKTSHTFSFAGYRDPEHTRFRSLRVMNEDVIRPGAGFGTHPHRDMEIVTYVLQGALEHRDSMGNGEVLHPGELQRMSAGAGITHSEFNPSDSEPVHLYQIWLLPSSKGIEPSYEQKAFPEEERTDRLCLVASPDGEAGSLRIHQDVKIFLSLLSSGTKLRTPLDEDRFSWLQVLSGSVRLNGVPLVCSDGAAVSNERHLEIVSDTDTVSEIMLFDLA